MRLASLTFSVLVKRFISENDSSALGDSADIELVDNQISTPANAEEVGASSAEECIELRIIRRLISNDSSRPGVHERLPSDS